MVHDERHKMCFWGDNKIYKIIDEQISDIIQQKRIESK